MLRKIIYFVSRGRFLLINLSFGVRKGQVFGKIKVRFWIKKGQLFW